MQVNILTYIDYHNANLETQLSLINNLNLKFLPVRKLEGKPLIELEEETLNAYLKQIKSSNLKVIVYDPLINTYELFDDKQRAHFELKWRQALSIAAKLKTESIYYRLPSFNNVIDHKEMIVQRLLFDFNQAKQAKVKVILKFCKEHKASVYFYLLKHLPKDISIEFDPAFLNINDESIITSFRLFKDRFYVVRCDEYDNNKHPRLLGFGEANWVEIFKKLFKIDFRGYIILDLSIIEAVALVDKKTPLIKKWSKGYRMKAKLQHDLQKRIGAETDEEIIGHQLRLLNKIVFNK